MTFRQFRKLLDNYEYSKAYYDFIRECSECELLEVVTSSQDFMESNESEISNFSESYFIEKIDKSHLKKLKEKLVNTLQSAWSKIVKAFEFLWKGFMFVILKLAKIGFDTAMDVFGIKEKIIKREKELRNKIDGDNVPANTEDIEKVNNILKGAGSPMNKFAEGIINQETITKIEEVVKKYKTFLDRVYTEPYIDERLKDKLSENGIKLTNILFSSKDKIMYSYKRYKLYDLFDSLDMILSGKIDKVDLKEKEDVKLSYTAEDCKKIKSTIEDINNKFRNKELDHLDSKTLSLVNTIYKELKVYLNDLTTILLVKNEIIVIQDIINKYNV